MNVPLKKEHADWIAEQDRLGRYASEVEAVEEAVAAKIAEEREAWRADGDLLRDRLGESVVQAERGEVVIADDAFFAKLNERVRGVARGEK